MWALGFWSFSPTEIGLNDLPSENLEPMKSLSQSALAGSKKPRLSGAHQAHKN